MIAVAVTVVVRSLRGLGLALAAVLLIAAHLAAQSRDQRSASVGMRAYVEQIVLPGSELEAAPGTMQSPLAVRVLKVWPHGDRFRYDLEWTGLEVGKFDLAKYLARKDGSATTDLPPIEVEVGGVLPMGMIEPTELVPVAPERLDGYSTLQIAVGVLWAAGLLAILLVGRSFRRKKVDTKPAPTLADRLRPLVETVAAGRGDVAAQAELERLLIAFWRARLDLGGVPAGEALATIRRHPEAGALQRQVEAWLHMPQPPRDVDWAALLAPYRSVTAHSFEPLPRPRET